MRSRILVSALLLVALFSSGAIASRGGNVAGSRQWSIVNFPDPVLVQNRFVMGQVLIVHDDQKMSRGEPCSTFYRFDPARGPQEEIVSFHCLPVERTVAATTRFTYAEQATPGCKRLIEYQIVGDAEAHGIPAK